MSIHTTAFSKIDGHDNRARILAGLGVKRIYAGIPVVQHAFTRPSAVASVEVEIETLLIAGKPIPDNIAAPIVAAEKHDAEQVARVAAIDAVARRYADDSQVTSPEAVTPALEYLNSELQRVIQAVKEQAETLDGVTTATQVIRAGGPALDAWRIVGELAAEYAEIRDTQREISKTIRNDGEAFTNEPFNRTAIYADAVDVLPYWIDRRNQYAAISSDANPTVQDYRAWLAAGRPSEAFETGLEDEHRMILIATTTSPWVPTPAQFQAADAAALYATSRVTVNNITEMEQARIKYYEATGVQHEHTVSERAKRPFSRAV